MKIERWKKLSAIDRKIVDAFARAFEEDGGPGSGNWGHKGRPGYVGGSGKGGGKKYRSEKEGGGYERKQLTPEEAAEKYANGKRSAFQGGHGPKFTPSGKNSANAETDPKNASVEDVRNAIQSREDRLEKARNAHRDAGANYREVHNNNFLARSRIARIERNGLISEETANEYREKMKGEHALQKKIEDLNNIAYEERPPRGSAEYDDWKSRSDEREKAREDLLAAMDELDKLYSAEHKLKEFDEYNKLKKQIADSNEAELEAINKRELENVKAAEADLKEYKERAKEHPKYLSDIYKSHVRSVYEGKNVTYNPPKRLTKQLTDKEIVDKIAGGDLTEGSCASLALVYAANRGGIDATDFRGGESCDIMAHNFRMGVAQMDGVDTKQEIGHSDYVNAKNLMKTMEIGKEYVLCTGRHASVVRKTDTGYQYLEMQAGWPGGNGWQDFDKKLNQTLIDRFRCGRTTSFAVSTLTDIDSLKNHPEVEKIVGYLNTNEGEQKRGRHGTIK